MLNGLEVWWNYKRTLAARFEAARLERAERKAEERAAREKLISTIKREKQLKEKYQRYFDMVKDKPLYNVSETLNEFMLDRFENYVLVKAVEERNHTTMTFDDGCVVTFWSANRMYAYASKIKINDQQFPENDQVSTWIAHLILEQVERVKVKSLIDQIKTPETSRKVTV